MKTKLACLFLALTIFACKKKDKDPDPIPVSTGNGSPVGDLSTLYIYTDYGNGQVSLDSTASASFYGAPLDTATPAYIRAGAVSINGVDMSYSGTGYYPLKTVNIRSVNWVVSGDSAGKVAGFSHSYVPVYPTFNGKGLPDTCVKSAGVNFIFNNGTSNGITTVVIISQSTNSAMKYLTATNGTISFSAQDLSKFNINAPIDINVSVTNITKAKIGKVYYNLLSQIGYFKHAFLK